uniref:Uncharacterized protein n=1 Tax=Cucumis sativus TaxID=3659 RepID=A0A0A0KV46_CUCSA
MDPLRTKILPEFQGVINKSLKHWQFEHSPKQYRSRIRWKPIKFNTIHTYEQEEIDAVRVEWAEFVGRFV